MTDNGSNRININVFYSIKKQVDWKNWPKTVESMSGSLSQRNSSTKNAQSWISSTIIFNFGNFFYKMFPNS